MVLSVIELHLFKYKMRFFMPCFMSWKLSGIFSIECSWMCM